MSHTKQKNFLAKHGILGTAETMSLIAGGDKNLLYRILEEYHNEQLDNENKDQENTNTHV